MLIQILGSGCANCRKLEKNLLKALKTVGKEAELGKVTAWQEIAAMGVLMTPALAVDGKVLSSGKVLSVREKIKLLRL